MRIALLALTVFVGSYIGLAGIDNLKDMQDKRMVACMAANPSLCNR
jgi:hypothetical protein